MVFAAVIGLRRQDPTLGESRVGQHLLGTAIRRCRDGLRSTRLERHCGGGLVASSTGAGCRATVPSFPFSDRRITEPFVVDEVRVARWRVLRNEHMLANGGVEMNPSIVVERIRHYTDLGGTGCGLHGLHSKPSG